jgi:hypothetical protein
LALTALAATLGAVRGGIVGVAWGMSLGFAATFVLTSLYGFLPLVGWNAWWRHQARLVRGMLWPCAGAVFAGGFPLGPCGPIREAVLRGMVLVVWLSPLVPGWLRHGDLLRYES